MMDEDIKDVAVQQQETPENHDAVIAQLKADMAKMQADMQAVVKKKEQLLDEKKKVSQSAAEKEKSLEQQLNELKSSIKDEKVSAGALSIASELAEGHNVKLLARFIRDDLRSLIEEEGALSADGLAHVKTMYLGNEEFKALLKGSKASGGGALGNSGNIQPKQNTVDRQTFDGWNPAKKMEFVKSGGNLVDKL